MTDMKYPYHKQQNDYYCGPTIVQMILGAHGIRRTQKKLATLMGTRSPYGAGYGTGRRDLVDRLRREGFTVRTQADSTLPQLRKLLKEGWTVVVNYAEVIDNIGHYAIVTAITPTHIVMCDPYYGPAYRLPLKVFLSRWHGGSYPNAYTHWHLATKRKL